MVEKYVVEGYEFNTVEEAKEAEKELEAVHFMMEKTRECTLENAHLIYQKIVNEGLFKTSIGNDYLKTLEARLIEGGLIEKPADSSPVNKMSEEKKQELKNRKKIEKLEAELTKVKGQLSTSYVINVLLIIAVAAMMYIASTSDNINILNYETKLQDEYSAWAQELRDKEQELKEREKALEKSE